MKYLNYWAMLQRCGIGDSIYLEFVAVGLGVCQLERDRMDIPITKKDQYYGVALVWLNHKVEEIEVQAETFFKFGMKFRDC